MKQFKHTHTHKKYYHRQINQKIKFVFVFDVLFFFDSNEYERKRLSNGKCVTPKKKNKQKQNATSFNQSKSIRQNVKLSQRKGATTFYPLQIKQNEENKMR